MPRESSQVGTHGQTGPDQGYQGQDSWKQGQTRRRRSQGDWNDRAQREMQQGDETRAGPARAARARSTRTSSRSTRTDRSSRTADQPLARQKPLLREGLLSVASGDRPRAPQARRLPVLSGKAASSAASRSASVGTGSFQRWTRTVWRPGMGSSLRPRSAGRPRRNRGRAIWPRRRPKPWCRSESDVPGEHLRVGPRQLLQGSARRGRRAPGRAPPPPMAVTSTIRSSSSMMKIGGPLAAGSRGAISIPS